jgi:hypothetical protein
MARYIVALGLYLILIKLPIFMAGEISLFMDLGTIIMVVIFPFLFVNVLLGFSQTKLAFKAAVCKDADRSTFTLALNYFKLWGKITWVTTILTIVIGAIQIFENQCAGEGAVWALMLVALYHAALIVALFIIPSKMLIKSKIITN